MAEQTLPPASHGPTEMLERASRLAHAPDTDSVGLDDLLSAASDLVEWGLFPEARLLVGKLQARGGYLKEAERLLKVMEFFAVAGPEFEPAFLATAIKTARDARASGENLLKAADSLLKWGALDEADIAIARLESRVNGKRMAGPLRAASRQLRRSGLLSEFRAVGSSETAPLNRPHEAVLARAGDDADKLIIAFTGADRKFWLSLHVLYHYLKRFKAHVLYLHDHSGTMFMNGLGTVAPNYSALLDLLHRQAGDLGVDHTYVMAFSAGGFVGLRASADINADAFLGFGMRTDMNPNTRLPMSKYALDVMDRCVDKSMLMNLRPYLEARSSPRSIQLVCAAGAKHDVAHAENLRGLARFNVAYLGDYNHHNVMPGLISRGLLDTVFAQFLGPRQRIDDLV